MKIFTARKITSVLCTCAMAFSFASTALAANPFPIMDERASAQYWEKPEYDAVIMDTQQIAKYNQSVIAIRIQIYLIWIYCQRLITEKKSS